jgi:aspartate aminotransferase
VALQCLVEPGDNVIVVAPIWPNIVIAIESMGATVRFVGLEETAGIWSLNLDRITEQLDNRTRAVFVASPNNPTGWVMSSAQQRELLELTRHAGVWVISDEVYNRLVYDGSVASPSFLELADPEDAVFIVQSCSKTWSMTGWRLGWLIHPTAIAHQVGNLSAINSTGSATFIQHAGAAAIRQGEPFVTELRERCLQGRSLVTRALSGKPRITVAEPPASFYSFIKISGTGNCRDFAEDLVTRAGVGIAPGTAFGSNYDQYFRICFAQDPIRLRTALDRLVAAL